MVRRVVVLGVAAGVILATAASVSVASGARSRPDLRSARSSATQTDASAGAKAAPPAPGFTSESLWSSSDDWEPNVATAPNSSYVYEVTTRYSTKFCAKGQGHCMAFRSSASYYSIDAQLEGGGDITCKIVVTAGPGYKPLTVSSGHASGQDNICSAQAAPAGTDSNGLPEWQSEN